MQITKIQVVMLQVLFVCFYQLTSLIKHTVSCPQHFKLSPSVHLVALFLQFLRERADHLLRQYIALLEELVFLSHTFLDALWIALAIALRRQAVSCYSMGNEISHHTLCSALR